MPTQAQILRSVARKGRGGDTDLAHVSKGDVVIPVEAQSKPEISAALKMLFQRAGLNQKKFTVGTGKRNYKTGLQAFDAESAGGDPSGGSGGDASGGSGGSGGSSGGGDTGGGGYGGDPGTGGGEPGGASAAGSNASEGGITGPSGAAAGTAGGFGPTGATGDPGQAPGTGPSDSSISVSAAPSLSQPAALSSEDLLSFDATAAPATGASLARANEQFGPGLGAGLASIAGYNVDPTLASEDLAGLFGPSVAPGFNTNVVDNALSVAGLFGGPLGLASTANTLGKDIFGVSLGSATKGITGLASPEASLGDLFGGKSIPGDPTTGDLVGATSTGPAGSQAGLRSGTGLEGAISGASSPTGGFPGVSGNDLGVGLGPGGGKSAGESGGGAFLDQIQQVLGGGQRNSIEGAPTTASRAPALRSSSPVIGPSPSTFGNFSGPSLADLIYQARALGELA